MNRPVVVCALTAAMLSTGVVVAAAEPGGNASLAAIADFTGDGAGDISVVRPDGSWFFLTDRTGIGFHWGNGYRPGRHDRPVPGDYDGDSITDPSVFVPDQGTWLVAPFRGEPYAIRLGAPGDIPVPGDYDGDGRTDLALFQPRDATWVVWRSSDGQRTSEQFGQPTDTLVPADYDGDGRTDLATLRPAAGDWSIRRSGDGAIEVRHLDVGGAGLAAPADYDGDGRTDAAVYRPADGIWIIEGRSDEPKFGRPGDVPVPAFYLPGLIEP